MAAAAGLHVAHAGLHAPQDVGTVPRHDRLAKRHGLDRVTKCGASAVTLGSLHVFRLQNSCDGRSIGLEARAMELGSSGSMRGCRVARWVV